MIVKFKKLSEDAVIPSYAHNTDAGMDMTAISKKWDDNLKCWIYGTGIALEVPEGHVGLIYPRSSVRKYNLMLCNHVGVVDSGYRGEVVFSFKPIDDSYDLSYNVGDKVGQLIIMPYPKVEAVEVDELDDSDRGTGGHGSTGR